MSMSSKPNRKRISEIRATSTRMETGSADAFVNLHAPSVL